jgi:hypothetical protein
LLQHEIVKRIAARNRKVTHHKQQLLKVRSSQRPPLAELQQSDCGMEIVQEMNRRNPDVEHLRQLAGHLFSKSNLPYSVFPAYMKYPIIVSLSNLVLFSYSVNLVLWFTLRTLLASVS